MDEDVVKKINSIEEAVEVVRNNAYNYYYLNDKLKNDKSVIVAAVMTDIDLFSYIPEAFKNNKEFILEIIEECPLIIESISDELKNDKMIIWKGLQQDGWTLKYASNEIKDNILFVLEAVKDTPEAIEFATQRIQDIAKNSQDAETNLKAYIKSEKLMHYINKELQEKQGIGTKKIKI